MPNFSIIITMIAFSRNTLLKNLQISILDPIFCLVLTVTRRHWLLEESIGAMEIENQAFQQLWIILLFGAFSLIFGSILSCSMFSWINSSLHPYIEILSDQIKEQKTVKNVEKVVLVSITHFNTE